MDASDIKDAIQKAKPKNGHQRSRVDRVIGIVTASLAILGGLAGLMSIRCNTRGILAKSEAVFAQEKTTNQWAYFQTRNIRIELAELYQEVVPKAKKNPEFLAKLERFKVQKDDLYESAKSLEDQRDHWNEKSNHYLELSRRFASSLALLQIAVALLPLTLLTSNLILFYTGGLMGLAGTGYLVVGFIHYLGV